MPRIPKYRRHSTGRAFVEYQGNRVYLPGKWGSEESRTAYGDFLVKLGTTPIAIAGAGAPPVVARTCTYVADLLAAYLEHAQSYYPPVKSGSGEYADCVRACRRAATHFGHLRLEDVKPSAVTGWRAAMVGERRHTRSYINVTIGRVVRAFRWGVEHELCPEAVYAPLALIRSLAAGRTPARESVPVEPVEWSDVESLLPHLPQTIADMVRLQWLTGCRPQNVCSLCPAEIDRRTSPWGWTPQRHKNVWRGHALTIYLGPRCQAILSPYLLRPPEQFCFQPAESRGYRDRPNRLRDHYDTRTYRQALLYGFAAMAGLKLPRGRKPTVAMLQATGVNPWSPHQLRHGRGTVIRSEFGLEGAQSILGHSNLAATQIYATRRLELARKIAMEAG